MEQFKAYLRDEEKSELTVEKYIRDVQRFQVWLGGRELSKCLVLKYLSFLPAVFSLLFTISHYEPPHSF